MRFLFFILFLQVCFKSLSPRLIVKTMFCLLTLCVCGGLATLFLVDTVKHQRFGKDMDALDIHGMVATAAEAGEEIIISIGNG